jgi:N-methylhydantoinase A
MPVNTLLSGPAAGVAAASHLGRQLKEPNLITFDMGGTSADVAAISDYDIVWTAHSEIDSLPLKIPMVEIVTIGAGGGSIAWKDEGGALQVGPQSAGADPGPICYGLGGEKITVTDANLLLGIIDPDFFLGGGFSLHEPATRKLARVLAKTLNYSIEELAEGVRRVVEANMLRAVKRVSTEKGLEPKNFGMVAFGGAGPIHAAAIMNDLELSKVIVPPSPGTFSAYGLLVADLKLDFTRTYLCDLKDDGVDRKVKEILASHARAASSALKVHGVPENEAIFTSSADLRYSGQSFEVNVPLSKAISETEVLFHRTHRKLYGYSIDDADVELVNVRLSVLVDRGKNIYGRSTNLQKKRKKNKKPEPSKHRSIILDGEKYRIPIYFRHNLGFGSEIPGPAVVLDSGSTTLILPDMVGTIDKLDNLIITDKN